MKKPNDPPSLRTVATALGIDAPTVHRWLLGLGFKGERTDNAFRLGRPIVAALVLNLRLSEFRIAGFNLLYKLFGCVISGKHEKDLREATLVVVGRPRRRYVLTAAPEVVGRHSGEEITWMVEEDALPMGFDGTLVVIKLGAVFERTDKLFAELNSEGAKKAKVVAVK